MARLYLGHRKGMPDELFRSPTTPTETTHGHVYFAVTGPFRTVAGAKIMQAQGVSGNPCFATVSECERAARLNRKP